jgi:hypothetical protein
MIACLYRREWFGGEEVGETLVNRGNGWRGKDGKESQLCQQCTSNSRLHISKNGNLIIKPKLHCYLSLTPCNASKLPTIPQFQTAKFNVSLVQREG